MGPVYCARSRSAFVRCWLGRVRSALQCSDLTHRLPFGCSALDEKARADTKIVPRLAECTSMNGFALTADEQFAAPLAALMNFLGSSGQLQLDMYF